MRKKQKIKAGRGRAAGILDVIGKTRTADSFQNPLTRAGYGMPNALETTQYPLTRLTQNYAELNSLYRSHWVVQKIINIIPQDMMKNGYEIQSDLEPDQIETIQRVIKQTRLDSKILEGLYWGRLYGGAAGIILIDGDDERLDEPLELDEVEPDSFKGLLIIDRWAGVAPGSELITDICSPEFGMPAYYHISLGNGGDKKIHHSRVCRFVGREMPYLEKLAENYWGTSELEHVLDELKKRDNVSWNISLLTFMANIRILKMQGLEEVLALGDQRAQEELYNTIEGMSMMLNNNAIQVLGAQDDYQQHTYSFGGLGEVYDRFMMDVSGACGIPVTKLFGRSPAGMNSTGDADMQNYYDTIESNQQAQLRPIFDKLLPIICVSALGAIPDDFEYMFNPVRRSSDSEKQDLGSQQTAAVTQAYTAGLISQRTALQELQQSSSRTGMWTNITDDDIAKADDEPMAAGEGPGGGDLMSLFGGDGNEREPKDEEDAGEDDYRDEGSLPTKDKNSFKEEEHPRGKDGKFETKQGAKRSNKPRKKKKDDLNKKRKHVKVDPTGSNTLVNRRFTSKENLDEHWVGGKSDHSAEYPGFTKWDYEKRAVELAEMACVPGKIDGYIDIKGCICRYDIELNDYVKADPVNGVLTLFKPTDGIEYFVRQKEKRR